MSNYQSLQHTKWECKYHVVFIPKYRKKLIYWGAAQTSRSGAATVGWAAGKLD